MKKRETLVERPSSDDRPGAVSDFTSKQDIESIIDHLFDMGEIRTMMPLSLLLAYVLALCRLVDAP